MQADNFRQIYTVLEVLFGFVLTEILPECLGIWNGPSVSKAGKGAPELQPLQCGSAKTQSDQLLDGLYCEELLLVNQKLTANLERLQERTQPG